jgi:hypothetical protein
MANSEAKTSRLVGRQFATPLTDAEIDQVAGGDPPSNETYHPGPGTCTQGPDDD